MNAGAAHSHESQFGPCSDLVNVSEFLREVEAVSLSSDAAAAEAPTGTPAYLLSSETREEWDRFDVAKKEAVSKQCSVSDSKSALDDAWRNPRLVAHLMKNHHEFVASIHDSADTSSKRKRKRDRLVDPTEEHTEVTALQQKLDGIRLKSWQLPSHSAIFMRAPMNSDQNALSEIKRMSNGTLPQTSSKPDALLTITIHNPISWSRGHVSRASQHVVLASQTLGNLFDVIPCTSNELPEELAEDDVLVGYDAGKRQTGRGCVICIENVAYGDGQSGQDYADKLLLQLEKIPPEKRPELRKSPAAMHDTTWKSLSVRINQPYWFLHRGNCEHYVVIDQIRLQHPSDVSAGYPLTVQITPPLLNLCRACTKVPAVWSIVGDVRLGESPCVMCTPCWQRMGAPTADEVIVVPLPRHELGW